MRHQTTLCIVSLIWLVTLEFKLSYPTICVDFYSDLMSCLVKINVDTVTKFSDSIPFFFFLKVVVPPSDTGAGCLIITQGFLFPRNAGVESWSWMGLLGEFMTKRAWQNVVMNLRWLQDGRVGLEVWDPKPFYQKCQLVPQGGASSSGCGLASA